MFNMGPDLGFNLQYVCMFVCLSVQNFKSNDWSRILCPEFQKQLLVNKIRKVSEGINNLWVAYAEMIRKG